MLGRCSQIVGVSLARLAMPFGATSSSCGMDRPLLDREGAPNWLPILHVYSWGKGVKYRAGRAQPLRKPSGFQPDRYQGAQRVSICRFGLNNQGSEGPYPNAHFRSQSRQVFGLNAPCSHRPA
jgi:hypothetical protein